MQNSDGAFQGHKGNQASVAAQIYLILTSVVKYVLSSQVWPDISYPHKCGKIYFILTSVARYILTSVVRYILSSHSGERGRHTWL